jgi:anhydro-N-acetylmuramic acid kinase
MNKAKRMIEVLQKRKRRLIGLMSGMSMDGVDLACVDIYGDFPQLMIDIVGTHYRAYTKGFQQRLRGSQNCTSEVVSQLNVLVAEEFSVCVNEFLDLNPKLVGTIDAIGSHGQTLYHSTDRDIAVKSSLQVGSPSVIADRTGLLTIGNFRVRDIAAGGTGAPLVSLADFFLFRRPNEVVLLNNLGSISNVTVVTPNLDDLIAFDTGPANILLDYFAQRLSPEAEGVDLDGRYSARGKIIAPLLAQLRNNPFFAERPPKAAGFKEFGPAYLAAVAGPYLSASVEDLLRTAVEFTAITIADAYEKFVHPKYGAIQHAIFSGGGVHNPTLMRRISELLPDLKTETLPSPLADAKEAIAFAVLANETLSGRSGSLATVTGALRPEALGEIAF